MRISATEHQGTFRVEKEAVIIIDSDSNSETSQDLSHRGGPGTVTSQGPSARIRCRGRSDANEGGDDDARGSNLSSGRNPLLVVENRQQSRATAMTMLPPAISDDYISFDSVTRALDAALLAAAMYMSVNDGVQEEDFTEQEPAAMIRDAGPQAAADDAVPATGSPDVVSTLEETEATTAAAADTALQESLLRAAGIQRPRDEDDAAPTDTTNRPADMQKQLTLVRTLVS